MDRPRPQRPARPAPLGLRPLDWLLPQNGLALRYDRAAVTILAVPSVARRELCSAVSRVPARKVVGGADGTRLRVKARGPRVRCLETPVARPVPTPGPSPVTAHDAWTP